MTFYLSICNSSKCDQVVTANDLPWSYSDSFHYTYAVHVMFVIIVFGGEMKLKEDIREIR